MKKLVFVFSMFFLVSLLNFVSCDDPKVGSSSFNKTVGEAKDESQSDSKDSVSTESKVKDKTQAVSQREAYYGDLMESEEFKAVRAEVQNCFDNVIEPASRGFPELYKSWEDELITKEEYYEKFEVLRADFEKVREKIVKSSVREERIKSAMEKATDEVLTFEEVMSICFMCSDLEISVGLTLYKEHEDLHDSYEAGSITKEEANKKIEEFQERLDRASGVMRYRMKVSPYVRSDDADKKMKESTKECLSKKKIPKNIHEMRKTFSPREIIGKKIP